MNELMKIEQEGQPVLTTGQLAQAYECDAKQLLQNFNNNISRFIEGQHYFKLEGDALREFKESVGSSKISNTLKFTSVIMLWTKRGASRHCKMLGTDKAWEVFDQLEETYFNQPQIPQRPLSQLEILAGSVEQLVAQDKAIKELKQRQEDTDKRIDGMKDVISLTSASWRKDTTVLINKMALKAGDIAKVRDFRHESYQILDDRMGVSVETRLVNMKRRMYEAGYSKTKISTVNALDVIDQDKKLIEGYVAIVKEMAIKYGVAA